MANPYVTFSIFFSKSVILDNPYVTFQVFLESVILVNQKLFLDYQPVKLFSFVFFFAIITFSLLDFAISLVVSKARAYSCTSFVSNTGSVTQCVLFLTLCKTPNNDIYAFRDLNSDAGAI